MRTNFVLIDFESVQPDSLAALEPDDFKVLVFVGANQTKVSFELAAALQRMGDKAEYIKIAGTGPNALDFHIAFYIGHLAAQSPTAYFHIISKDTGFDPLVQHLRSRKILSARVAQVDDIPFVKARTTKLPDQRAEFTIAKLKQPKATRPRTAETLANAVATLFQKQLTEQEVAAVIAAMQSAGFVTVADGKITYAEGGSAKKAEMIGRSSQPRA